MLVDQTSDVTKAELKTYKLVSFFSLQVLFYNISN